MGGGPPGFRRGFTCPVLLGNSPGCRFVSPTGLSPAAAGLSRPFGYKSTMPHRAPATPQSKPCGLASSDFARHYSRNLVLISSPRGTEMFHFPRYRPGHLFIQCPVAGQTPAGFPHSEIPGSKPACGSPGLIAVSRVLHRLLVPRHPSRARICLTGAKSPVHALRCISIPKKLCKLSKNGPAGDPAGKSCASPPCRRGPDGGRAWSRTRDLVLIRDAL